MSAELWFQRPRSIQKGDDVMKLTLVFASLSLKSISAPQPLTLAKGPCREDPVPVTTIAALVVAAIDAVSGDPLDVPNNPHTQNSTAPRSDEILRGLNRSSLTSTHSPPCKAIYTQQYVERSLSCTSDSVGAGNIDLWALKE